MSAPSKSKTLAIVQQPAAQLYDRLVADIKQRIRTAQVRTAMAGNASMLMLYWEIGGVLVERQKSEGWGAAILPRLATDLHNDLPGVKGFSVRNLKLMTQFFREYPDFFAIGQRPVAQLTWAHNVILIQKVKHLPTRLWYAQKAFEQGWSRDVLSLQIQSRAHEQHEPSPISSKHCRRRSPTRDPAPERPLRLRFSHAGGNPFMSASSELACSGISRIFSWN